MSDLLIYVSFLSFACKNWRYESQRAVRDFIFIAAASITTDRSLWTQADYSGFTDNIALYIQLNSSRRKA